MILLYNKKLIKLFDGNYAGMYSFFLISCNLSEFTVISISIFVLVVCRRINFSEAVDSRTFPIVDFCFIKNNLLTSKILTLENYRCIMEWNIWGNHSPLPPVEVFILASN